MKLNPMSAMSTAMNQIMAFVRSVVTRSSIRAKNWTRFAAVASAVMLVTMDSSVAMAGDASPAGAGKILIFRNIPSWNRTPDFEDAIRTLGLPFDVKKSSDMKGTRLSDYRVVLIPGAQWETGYYADFASAASAFDDYVKAGGTLLLELNGAEREGITLPGGASMMAHEGFNNLIILPRHPAVSSFGQKRIEANLASHGYLVRVPADALVLATVAGEANDSADMKKPTYVEYAHGKGRVIAACQCFHDQDNSGRGPMMPAAVTYAMAGKWYSAK
jgi:hypothetical protein